MTRHLTRRVPHTLKLKLTIAGLATVTLIPSTICVIAIGYPQQFVWPLLVAFLTIAILMCYQYSDGEPASKQCLYSLYVFLAVSTVFLLTSVPYIFVSVVIIFSLLTGIHDWLKNRPKYIGHDYQERIGKILMLEQGIDIHLPANSKLLPRLEELVNQINEHEYPLILKEVEQREGEALRYQFLVSAHYKSDAGKRFSDLLDLPVHDSEGKLLIQ